MSMVGGRIPMVMVMRRQFVFVSDQHFLALKNTPLKLLKIVQNVNRRRSIIILNFLASRFSSPVLPDSTLPLSFHLFLVKPF